MIDPLGSQDRGRITEYSVMIGIAVGYSWGVVEKILYCNLKTLNASDVFEKIIDQTGRRWYIETAIGLLSNRL